MTSIHSSKQSHKDLINKWYAWIGGKTPNRTIFNPRFLIRRSLDQYIFAASRKMKHHMVILDIGCANKPYRPFFDKSGSFLYIGLEPQLQRSGHPNYVPPDLVGDAHKIPLKDNSVDGILLTEILEHVPRPGDILCEVYRVLKEDGEVILTAPFMIYEHNDPSDYGRFTLQGIKNLLDNQKINSKWKMKSALETLGRFLCRLFNSLLTINCTRIDGELGSVIP